MPRKIPRLLWLAAPLAYFLYFYGLRTAGMLGPDEPRYASVARAMATSGDWITPHLWGQAWFEKPPLLYWMTASAFRLGLGPDLAPRLPVAILALAFLIFYWWILNRYFGCLTAWFATLILGTSVEWLVFSQVAVTDLPLTAAFSVAMLLAVPWVARGDARALPWAGAFLGVAVLAKGLVPLALAAPLAIGVWKRPPGESARAVLRFAGPLLVVALPWYVLCYRANGMIFLHDFLWVHHFERVTSAALMHPEPWWFYGRILLGALVPWTPLLFLAARPSLYRDRTHLFLLVVFLWGLLFFSVPLNKLPGYLLPLLPFAAVLLAVALHEARRVGLVLVLCALLLAVFPIMAPALPAAIASGLTRAPTPVFQPAWLVTLAVAAIAWFLETRKRRLAVVLTIAAGATAGVVYLKRAAMPEVDRLATSRQLWGQIAGHADSVCVENIHRNWRYPLNYYSVTPLPECAAAARPIHISQVPGHPPRIAPQPTVDRVAAGIVLSPIQDSKR
jgi:4-amino-4-deoxy-L-arabinose transferase-like glycosyltransferase